MQKIRQIDWDTVYTVLSGLLATVVIIWVAGFMFGACWAQCPGYLQEPRPVEVTEPELVCLPELISLGIFRVTAYCPCVICCEIWSAEHPLRIGTDFVQHTASGTIPQAGRTIATDTNIIPFGTIVVISGHEFVAEDRGGAIRGNRIDIFFDCHQEALNFGVQHLEVYIKNERSNPSVH